MNTAATSSRTEPQVTVVVPTYNRTEALGEALNSITRQTFDDFEVIVVNDCGCDVSEMVNSLEDQRIRLIDHPENRGVSAARNTALDAAGGKFVAFLDDDDRWYENHLEVLLQAINAREERVVYSDCMELVQEEVAGKLETVTSEKMHTHDFHQATLLLHNLAPPQCFLVERSLLQDGVRFDETLPTHEDWYFFLQLSRLTPFYHVATVTGEHREQRGKDSLSKNLQSMLETLSEIYRRTHPLVEQQPAILRMRQQVKAHLQQRLQTSIRQRGT